MSTQTKICIPKFEETIDYEDPEPGVKGLLGKVKPEWGECDIKVRKSDLFWLLDVEIDVDVVILI